MLEWLVVVLISHLSCGISALNGINQHQKHLRQRDKCIDLLTDAATGVWDSSSD